MPPKLAATWRADLIAGAVVAVLLIPQSLAYAMLAGVPPQVGLYPSLLPLLAYAALGSSPVLGLGPVAVLALMIAQALGALPAGVTPTEGVTSTAIGLAAQGDHEPVSFTAEPGLDEGAAVTVTPTDYAYDAVSGALVGLGREEVVIARRDPRAGRVHVHFPRLGFQIKVSPPH